MEFTDIPVLRRESTADYIDFNNNSHLNDTDRLIELLDSLQDDIKKLEKNRDSEEESEINWSFSESDLVVPENIWDPKVEQMFIQDDIELDDLVYSEMSSENVDSTNTECCICYEIIDKKKNNCITECGHSFCLKCLATSMYHNNNACPCCRTALVDEEKEEEGDEDEEDDEDDDYTTVVDESEEGEETFYADCDVEEVTRRLESNGFTTMEIVSMLIGRYSRDEKYTMEYIHEMNKKFDKILDEADRETYEQKMFAAEDMRDPPISILGL